jgi:hypothetical protein
LSSSSPNIPLPLAPTDMSSPNIQDNIAPSEDVESAVPSVTEGSASTTDTQAAGASGWKLHDRTIYLKIEGRGTNANVSVWAMPSQAGRSPLPRGNKEGTAQQCIGTLISHFNNEEREFKKGVSQQTSEEGQEEVTGRSAHADQLVKTKKTMQEMMDRYNGTKKAEESEISFFPEELPSNISSQRRVSSIPSKNLSLWARKASQDPSSKAEASTSSATVTDTLE